MALSKDNWRRMLGGYACLLAVMLTYAPQGMLAWWTATRACCKSNYCPIAEHHRAPKGPATSQHDGMDCEHKGAGLAECTMSCCHDKENALMAPVAFVLGASAELQTTTLVSRMAQAPASKDIVQSCEPLSPPPRLTAAA